MLKILIIDDLPKIRSMVADIINLQCDDAKVVGFAEDVKSGIAAIETYKPDIVLLDIKLPDGTGFDILSNLKKEFCNFQVIFITAYQEFAVKAFKFSAIDYILKPVDPDELLAAIDKCRKQGSQGLHEQMETFSFNSNKQNSNKKLALKTLESIHVVEINDIIRCEATSSYTTFYLLNDNPVVVSKGIGEYEEILNEYGFYRIHHTHIINLKFMKCFEKQDGGYVIMKDKAVIPVSKRKKDAFLQLIEGL